MIKDIVIILMAYLIGAISPAYVLGRLIKGKDLRKLGTKNLGGANVYKNLGVVPALIVVVFDIFKGVLAMFIGFYHGLFYIPLAGIAAILGHDYPFYLNFDGGKGTATTAGVLGSLIYLFNGVELSIAFFIVIIVYLVGKGIVVRRRNGVFFG